MYSLAEFMILSSRDNSPPMLEKHLYDSWNSIMELYMQNREHGRMILESVEHGLLIWPMIEKNGVTKTKKYKELSATEKIQADCDLKATNIILQGLPLDVYSLVNTKFLNSLPPKWSKFVTDVKLVRDLHTNNFDQLHAYLEQHELHTYEVRIMRECNQDPLALVANHQMTPLHFNTYQSSCNNLQFQKKFSPSQSPQYGSIHPTQHYSTTYPSIPHALTYPSILYPNAYSSTVHQDACLQPQSIPQIEYIVSTVNQQTHLTEFPQIDSGLTVLVFKKGDDPIDAINKMMSFMSTVVTSRFPTTNNQLRNSSNPRQQATIHDGRVTVQPAQGRQSSFATGTSITRANISRTGRNNSGQQRVVKCFNCQREGHMARQCPMPKRKKDATWFRDKVLLVEAQGSAKAVFMANLSSYRSYVLSEVPQSENTHNDMLNQSVQEMPYSKQTHLVNYPENEITSDSNIIPYSQYLLETQNAAVQDTNSSAQQDAMILFLKRYKERLKLLQERQNVDLSTREKLIMDNIIREKNAQFADFEKEINYLKQTLFEQSKEKKLLTKTFNDFKNESKEKEAKNIDKEIALEKKVKELDNIKAQQIRPMLYDGSVIAKETNVILIPDSEETLMLEEESRSKMLLKQIENATQVSNATTIAPGMYKLDPLILASKVKNNREAHEYYLKHTMEQAAILRKIVEQAKSLNPLDSASYYACKYVKLIQELLGVVREALCALVCLEPFKTLVTPINGKKTVRKDFYFSCKCVPFNWDFTATNKVPHRKPIPLEVVAQESIVTKVYTRRSMVVQIVLSYLDSECSKHMTGDLSQLTNFVHKFLGTIKFGNNQIAKIMGYYDYQIGNITISRVYYVEGLGHNLFSVGQFCDSDLEVAFRKHTCFVRNLESVDLL
ncbi:retrovirus-related pol polyprotein from transposon TNT 1-94 [Tanacetum coccineum]